MQTVGQAGRQDEYANSLERKKNEAELTKKKSSLSHKPLGLTRLLSTTTQVKQQKKATIISATYTLNQNVTARFFISSFFKTNITQTIIYETFLRYSNQNKQPTKKEAEKRFKTNKSKTSTATTLLSRTKQDENNKLTHIGEG